tara:strand:+ start:130 stop:492 length:363 start_codon:yes stop_codon:yes gene_type:complete
MIINLTDAEALALSQALQTEPLGGGVLAGGLEEGGLEEGGLEKSPSTLNIEALNSAKAKLRAAMQKADAKLGRSLDYAISSLEGSGFDGDQLEALRGAKEKAAVHNESKYVARDKGKLSK